MNDKQEAYCQEYCRNGYNASQAYKKIYSAKGGWNKLAAQLMAKNGIRERIEQIKSDIEAWSSKNRDLLDKLFQERYVACVARGDNTNAIRCIENKAKNVGYYAADNAQQRESRKLTEEQLDQVEEFMKWRQQQVLKRA